MSSPRLILVLGGTRSGKSAVAERLAAAAGGPVRYLATAPTGEDGDHDRIAQHRSRRPASWETVEVAAIQDLALPVRDAGASTVLLDGLGAWLAGVLHDAGLLDDDGRREDPAGAIDGAAALAGIEHAVAALADAACAREALTVVVGEEAGMAPVAATRGTRRWVDLLGSAHQALAARADRVLLVVAGHAIELTDVGAGPEIGSAPQTSLPLGTAPAVAASVPAVATGLPEAAADRPADGESEVLPPAAVVVGADAVAEGHRREDEGEPVPSASGAPLPVHPEDATPVDAVLDGDPAAPGDAGVPGNAGHGVAGAPPRTPARPLPASLPVPPGARLHGDRMVPEGMLDFAVNVVHGDPPGWARQALMNGLETGKRYPDDRAASEALAERHDRAADGVLPLGGAVEGFWRLALALRPVRAAVVVPGFTESEAALRTVGCEIVRVPREAKFDWKLDPEAVPEDCDLVVVGRPENPTGVLDARESILRLRRPGRTVLVDEAFADFVGEDALAASGGALADQRPADHGPGDLVVLRSLTKSLSVPGIRCGYLLGDPELVAAVREAGPPWTCPTPALELLRAYAGRPDATGRIAARTAAHRGDLVARLRQLAGVQVWDGAANFVLVRTPAGVDAVAGLHDHGIAVRPCTTFAGLDDRYVRIAVRTPALHAELTTALARVISAAE
ncbi:bifunctional adenosylcobinamide kinase/adenosylcobinamide-phosphate guanylyltransferase [Patulibacter minatonensis]|uniref:bifunctional adenosylcobinamide kinase/adenosylcobinamide-phosphate guanylyltransferase n=1 Tax=Patulibacter minatonensis TaxID=298163 RepID=UPI0004B000E4|nr:bifunctional adenosylcobinamide kinase/adenosylcobinamide-phosphate guanylyltransferase [Patulibacter minatonensis]